MKRILTLTTTALALGSALLLTGCDQQGDTSATITQASQEQVLEYHIEGMHCDGCASNVQYDLSKLAGVSSCEVSFDESKATVHLTDPDAASTVVEAVKSMGYTIALADGDETDAGADELEPAEDYDLPEDDGAEIEGPLPG